LIISKSVDQSSAQNGQYINYTINFKNNGTANCTGGGVEVKDFVDQNLIAISESHSGNVLAGYGSESWYNSSSRTIFWNAQELVPGESGWVSWTAKVNIPNTCNDVNIPNKAGITSAEYNNFNNWVYSNTVNTNIDVVCMTPPLHRHLQEHQLRPLLHLHPELRHLRQHLH
jgi:uncharacterized repeat protein (TIGR01451 family)